MYIRFTAIIPVWSKKIAIEVNKFTWKDINCVQKACSISCGTTGQLRPLQLSDHANQRYHVEIREHSTTRQDSLGSVLDMTGQSEICTFNDRALQNLVRSELRTNWWVSDASCNVGSKMYVT